MPTNQTGHCHNGGVCLLNQQIGDFECQCQPGYFGTLCEGQWQCCHANRGLVMASIGCLSNIIACQLWGCKAHMRLDFYHTSY